jgi:hypothetical protein
MGFAHPVPFFNITAPSGQQVNANNVIRSNGPDFDLDNGVILGAILNFGTAALNHRSYFNDITQCQDLLPAPGRRRETDEEINDEFKKLFNYTG